MDLSPEFFQNFPPLARVALAFFLILVVPMLCRWVSLPAVVGLLVAGVVIGPNGLKIIPQNPVVGNFLAELGKLMLMMFAGIEIDHALFKRIWRRSALFGFFTFLLPLLAGMAVGFLFGYYWVAALLVAALVVYNTVDKNGQRLIDEPVLNTIIVLMVVTSILGPVLTERFSRQIVGQRASNAGAT